MSMRDDLAVAVSVPPVPPFASLVAGLKMAGLTVIPDDMWNSVAAALLDFEGSWSELDVPLQLHEHHVRSGSHEDWQYRIGHRLVEPFRTVWAIPVEEFICLAADDPFYEDFTQLTRFTFVGTYSEMLGAVARLVDALKGENGGT